MSAITESARNEQCQIRLPGICNHDPATVVWAHANGLAAGHGYNHKSLELLGSYACFDCHNEVDRRTRKLELDFVNLAFHEGHQRSLIILIRKGLVVCK